MINSEFKSILNSHMQSNVKCSPEVTTRVSSSAHGFHKVPSIPDISRRTMHSKVTWPRSLFLSIQPERAGVKFRQLCTRQTFKYSGAAVLFGLIGYKLSTPTREDSDISCINKGP